MTKLDIIEETVEYYKTHNRATNKAGGCFYLSEQGDMCAIGRCCRRPSQTWGNND